MSRLPIGVERWNALEDAVRDLLNASISERVFPGAIAAVVGVGGQTIVAAGKHTYEEEGPAITPEAMFDLASLTKVVATATAVMRMHERGMISIEDRVASYLPEFREGTKSGVTIAHLLSHRAGLPAFAPFHKVGGSRSALLQIVRTWPLEGPPGSTRVYDDLSYISLGEIVERISGLSLARYCREHIFQPLGMANTCFCPPREVRATVVPTEVDSIRGGLIQGFAHDENAYALGGVAGHAGLFSTAPDLMRFASILLLGFSDASSVLSRQGVEKLREPVWKDEEGEYGLAWDRTRPSYMNGISDPDVFGHTGFTGTSIVVAPNWGLAMTLLSNAVHPRRQSRTRIDGVRRRFAETVMGHLA